nr:MAG TPA: Major capsid protein [Caudoviricetes sp.]
MANPVMTSLTSYVEQRRLPLIKEAVLKAKSASLFNLQTDIKTSAALNLLSTAIQFGDGLACGWNEAGTQTLSQRILATGNIKINMAYCDKEMLKYWTQYQVRVAAGQKTLPFEEDFVNAVVENVKAAIETAIWQGDTASEINNLKYFDGLLKILKDAAGTVDVAITGTSAYDDIMTVYNAIPEKVLDGASILVGSDTFRKFIQELVAKNYYHYSGENLNGEIMLPGSQVKVIAVNGLNGTDKIVAGQLDKNFFYGCDMMNDEEKFELWYSQDFREFRLAIEFNAGVQVAFPDEVVLGAKA